MIIINVATLHLCLSRTEHKKRKHSQNVFDKLLSFSDSDINTCVMDDNQIR